MLVTFAKEHFSVRLVDCEAAIVSDQVFVFVCNEGVLLLHFQSLDFQLTSFTLVRLKRKLV